MWWERWRILVLVILWLCKGIGDLCLMEWIVAGGGIRWWNSGLLDCMGICRTGRVELGTAGAGACRGSSF